MSDDSATSVHAVWRGCDYRWVDESVDEADRLKLWSSTSGEPGAVDPEDFGIGVTVYIGPDNDPGVIDDFEAAVCSAKWFSAQLAAGRWDNPWFWSPWPPSIPAKMMHPSGVWLMERWSQDDFQRAVEALCESVSPAPD